ncbi:hypothetical protein ALC60_11349 [Trachymyrmex zeteki]|uniref:Uncharacterized protein n=1 Tax=Mycetomoellerius zeteki TaxID=64791 RepID=A0A151WPE5_9HYME|nr:hypothetical protein ALC60_11349 [Trachymyrmex zeteki]
MLRSSQSVRFEVGNYVNQNENWRRLVPVGLIIEIRVDVGSVGMRRAETWRENMGIPPRRNGGSCSDGFGPHYELRGRGNHDDSNFGDIIKYPKNPQQDFAVEPGRFLTCVVHNGKEGYIAFQDISYGSRWILICFRQSSRSSSRSPLAHHPVTSSATEVDIRSPRFDVGYIIRRSEYAPGFEREEREGRRAGRCARGGYSNGPTLVWKCARCKDDGGIRREPRRGDITSR